MTDSKQQRFSLIDWIDFGNQSFVKDSQRDDSNCLLVPTDRLDEYLALLNSQPTTIQGELSEIDKMKLSCNHFGMAEDCTVKWITTSKESNQRIWDALNSTTVQGGDELVERIRGEIASFDDELNTSAKAKGHGPGECIACDAMRKSKAVFQDCLSVLQHRQDGVVINVSLAQQLFGEAKARGHDQHFTSIANRQAAQLKLAIEKAEKQE